MALAPRGTRRFLLTCHVVSSVGWLGALACFLALALVGLTTEDGELARATYLAMESVGWLVLVPLALIALVSGVVQSLVTKWGLVRHYWVLIKLILTLIATVILLLYTQTLGTFARMAENPQTVLHELQNPSPVVHAGLGVILLLVATVLAVYKPSGLTRYGRARRQ